MIPGAWAGRKKRKEIKVVRKQCENFHMLPGWRKPDKSGTQGTKRIRDTARELEEFARNGKCFHAKCVDLIVVCYITKKQNCLIMNKTQVALNQNCPDSQASDSRKQT